MAVPSQPTPIGPTASILSTRVISENAITVNLNSAARAAPTIQNGGREFFPEVSLWNMATKKCRSEVCDWFVYRAAATRHVRRSADTAVFCEENHILLSEST